MKSNTSQTFQKHIALVAHDERKLDLLSWATYNRGTLAEHRLYATGTTGSLLEREAGLDVVKLKSGPWGGDQQVGAKIADGEIDFLIFFWDPHELYAHDSDVKALLRLAAVWNIPVACNRASADFMISSPLMTREYDRIVPDYEGYLDTRGAGSASPAMPSAPPQATTTRTADAYDGYSLTATDRMS